MNTPDLTLPLQLSLMDELRLSCRKLFLRRHEVQAHIGAHDFEKGVTQRLWIDVELWVPFERSTPSLDSSFASFLISTMPVWIIFPRAVSTIR